LRLVFTALLFWPALGSGAFVIYGLKLELEKEFNLLKHGQKM
jgi:hypothetical protein